MLIFFGQEIKIKASGYDPRDIIFGNYILLDYALRPKENDFLAPESRTFFVSLEDENKDGIYEFSTIS